MPAMVQRLDNTPQKKEKKYKVFFLLPPDSKQEIELRSLTIRRKL